MTTKIAAERTLSAVKASIPMTWWVTGFMVIVLGFGYLD
mgnify:CR=1 FL=1|jgi:hypothetical protein